GRRQAPVQPVEEGQRAAVAQRPPHLLPARPRQRPARGRYVRLGPGAVVEPAVGPEDRQRPLGPPPAPPPPPLHPPAALARAPPRVPPPPPPPRPAPRAARVLGFRRPPVGCPGPLPAPPPPPPVARQHLAGLALGVEDVQPHLQPGRLLGPGPGQRPQ